MIPRTREPARDAAARTTVLLSRPGRAARAGVTAVAGLVLLAGSLWGTNDHFPFGPFTMYATARRTDGYVRQTRVEAVDVEGRRFTVNDSSTGLRRAEIEGQIAGFRDEPHRLASVADAYERRHPDAPAIVRVDIVQRRYSLEDGQPSGEITKDTVLTWMAGDAPAGDAPAGDAPAGDGP